VFLEQGSSGSSSLRDPALAAAGGGVGGGGGADSAAAITEQCLRLAGLLGDVAAATAPAGGSSGSANSSSGSSWWASPLQRLVHNRVTAAMGRALVRLGATSASGAAGGQPLLLQQAASVADVGAAAAGQLPRVQLLAGA
jgi:hypothetical protein